MRVLIVCSVLCVLLGINCFSDVVINEIHYNPPDDDLEDGSYREFIELYNSGDELIDLTGYKFTKGVQFTFPDNTLIYSHSYIVIAKNLTHKTWNNSSFKIVGPYEGKLSNSGERLTLARADDSIVDEFKYSDLFPWPLGADGYGSSLERIDWSLEADDFHSWRSSLKEEGTPGRANSVVGMISTPVITNHAIIPEHPTSSDQVKIQIAFDAPDTIKSVDLLYESLSENPPENVLVSAYSKWRYWKGRTAPSSSMNWVLESFNDSSWDEGNGGFGYGDLDEVNTVLSDMKGGYSTVYLRKEFSVDFADLTSDLTLSIYYDDGFICYLNGVEVARANAPQDYTHTSLSNSTFESNEVYTFSINNDDLLVEGNNIIALVGFNTSRGGSSDFFLAPTLLMGLEEDGHKIPMSKIADGIASATYVAVLPSMPSQNLVRTNVVVNLTNGESLVLPHEAEPKPFISYFVYDDEIESKLPLLWIMSPKKSSLVASSGYYGAVVAKQVSDDHPRLFDGALIIPSASNRKKIRFLKGEEFYGDRTINVIPEVPTGGTNAGISSPYREHLGYWFFNEMEVPSSWAEFYRIIQLPASSNDVQAQHLVIQQVNERFLELHDRNPDGDLYKMVYSNPNLEKHTNKDEGTEIIEELIRNLSSSNKSIRQKAIDENIDVDEFLAYSAASIFVSNWDGYWNNNWLYRDPDTNRWEMIPWDLDWIWGATPPPDTGPMYSKMPLSFPIDGRAVGDTRVSRAPGVVTSPLHKDADFYQLYLDKLASTFNKHFTLEKLYSKIDDDQQLLLDDLDLINQQTGRYINQRSQQIRDSYATLKQFIKERREYLEGYLPVGINDWSVY